MTSNPRLPADGEGKNLLRDAFASVPAGPLAETQHLLKVANSISHDAIGAWMEVWTELRDCVASGDKSMSDSQKRFLPSCGWDEFIEKLWLLKHYLDSIQRISTTKQHPLAGASPRHHEHEVD
jgi:hypothetical protein